MNKRTLSRRMMVLNATQARAKLYKLLEEISQTHDPVQIPASAEMLFTALGCFVFFLFPGIFVDLAKLIGGNL